jgi:hypothetical protein
MSDENQERPPDQYVSREFIEENRRLNLVKPRKKFVPYTKVERVRRRKEVYRLHFELGIHAVKIAEMMKVDKNTVNNDIQLLYRATGSRLRYQKKSGIDSTSKNLTLSSLWMKATNWY